MPDTVSLADAKAHIDELVARAAAGEEILISEDGRPLARLIPAGAAGLRQPGAWAHLRDRITDETLLEPAEAEDLDAAEGKLTDAFGISRHRRQ
ncbi:MAG TPA: type II toxin-antitoxin system prevent-host-death family antitoxin [Azospirillum sp.]|nr:type II toxin-antitoxin system prevent-host-death family antitoxin [Azospirillum sp.]